MNIFPRALSTKLLFFPILSQLGVIGVMSYVLGKDLKLQSQLREIQLQLEELERDVAENIESDTTSIIDSMCSSVSFEILGPM